jgi:biopolymer transport protein ExbD
MNNCLGLILVALTLPAALVSQTSPSDPAIGTWKLNVAKSKFKPGPPPKSITVTIANDGKVTVNQTSAEGKDTNFSFTPSEGKPVTIEGLDGTTVSQKRIDDRVSEYTWTTANTSMHGRAVISANGKIMKYTVTGTRPDGKAVHNSELYEKQ